MGLGSFAMAARTVRTIAYAMPDHEEQKQVGVIGLGLMGTALTERLLGHGYRVAVPVIGTAKGTKG